MKIYHNPQCSKSRQTLQLIKDQGIQPEIILYKSTPPTVNELKEVIAKTGLKPMDIIRKGEAIFKEKYKGKELTDDEWIEVMVAHPTLIERPIVIEGNKAILGRPPQNVVELFG